MDIYEDYYFDKDKVPDLTYEEFLEIREGCFYGLYADFWGNAFKDQERLQKIVMFVDRYCLNILKNIDKIKNKA